MNYVSCGLCNYEFEHGVHVCQGCLGDVIYGATQHERNQGFKNGAGIAAVLTGVLVWMVPVWVNSAFAWKIPIGLGLGAFPSLIVVAAAGLVGAFVGLNLTVKEHAGQVRTFRRRAA